MQKDKKLYFIVGFVVLLTMVILVFGVFFLNEHDPREHFNRYHILFTQVSTLNFDDPVKVNGVKLGKVEDMVLEGNRVRVQIRLRHDVKIPKDSRVKVQNVGLMGERQIGMVLGDDTEYYNPGDTLPGIFDAGIAEAMGLAGEIFDSTHTLIRSVKDILDSTVAHPEFSQRFHGLLKQTEALELRVARMINETDPELQKLLGNLNIVTEKVNDLLDENTEPLEDLMGDAKVLTSGANEMLVTMDSLLIRVDVLVRRLQAKDNTLGVLLNDRKLHDELSNVVSSADSLFRTILEDGLDVNIDFF
ncbi:MAG: MCE family protein [Fibrobacter sp.]|nr:MCE family protein [Fibrobacter sp.]